MARLGHDDLAPDHCEQASVTVEPSEDRWAAWPLVHGVNEGFGPEVGGGRGAP